MSSINVPQTSEFDQLRDACDRITGILAIVDEGLRSGWDDMIAESLHSLLQITWQVHEHEHDERSWLCEATEVISRMLARVSVGLTSDLAEALRLDLGRLNLALWRRRWELA